MDNSDLLRAWATLGSALRNVQTRPVPNWAAVDRLIAAARLKLGEETERLKRLLAESRRRLHPLEDPIKPWLHPRPEDWESQWANLGVKVEHTSLPQGIAWSESFCALYWDYTGPEPLFYAWVGVSLPKKLADVLYSKLQHVGTKKLSREPKTIWVERGLTVEAIATFDVVLKELLCQWIDAWKKIGGFQAILPAASPTPLEQGDPHQPHELA